MKKIFYLSGIALMLLVPFSANAAVEDEDLGGKLAPDQTLLATEESPPDHLPEYWLGLEIYNAPSSLRAHLHLPENQGFVVKSVMPDSPAAKVGLVENDIILKADGKTLSKLFDLLEAVDAAKDREMKLEIIHEGQTKTITLTPAKRPEQAAAQTGVPQAQEFDALQKWLERMRPGTRFQFMKPGIILPPGAPIHPPLPGNMSITIAKTGDKPADIIVTMDDKKWQVTEKELDKLPEKVQPYVKRMLGLTLGAGSWTPNIVMPEMPQMPDVFGGQAPGIHLPPMPDLERRFDKRLEEMNRRIERINQELRRWQQGDMAPEQNQPTQPAQPNQPAEPVEQPPQENVL